MIVPAFMWSFLHSNYPQEPPYIRGIEIGLFGMVAGLVIFRSGINFKLDRASNVNFPADVWIDRNVKFPANWFDYQSLSRFGK